MRSFPRRCLVLVAALSLCPALPADEPTTQPVQTKAEKRKALEREFQQALENSTLKGTWAMTGPDGLAGKAPLSEAREDKRERFRDALRGDPGPRRRRRRRGGRGGRASGEDLRKLTLGVHKLTEDREKLIRRPDGEAVAGVMP